MYHCGGIFEAGRDGGSNTGHTSSRLDCFALLVLIEDAPASLLVVVWLVSRTGRGMAEVLDGLLAKGMAPRPCPRPGVPRTVPGLTDIALRFSALGRRCVRGRG